MAQASPWPNGLGFAQMREQPNIQTQEPMPTRERSNDGRRVLASLSSQASLFQSFFDEGIGARNRTALIVSCSASRKRATNGN
jgi:hypothetical protein